MVAFPTAARSQLVYPDADEDADTYDNACSCVHECLLARDQVIA
jgi:hypothetical protein